MGILSDIFGGGSSPDAPEPSAEEIALAATSAKDFNRFMQKGVPLEAFAVEESTDSNVRDAIAANITGRANGDVAQQEMGAQRSARESALRSGAGLTSANNMAGVTDTSRLASTGQAEANVIGDREARNIQDKMMLTSLQSGAGFAQNAQAGLSASARLANSRSATRFEADMIKSNARDQALMSAVDGAMAGGLERYDKNKRAKQERINNSEDATEIGLYPDYSNIA